MHPHTNGQPLKRFCRGAKCPVCGGSEDDPRGQGSRCYGFVSGNWIHCTREEHSPGCRYHEDSQTYSHRLHGPCKCGVEHGPAPVSLNGKHRGKSRRGEEDALYTYRDRDGRDLFQVVRFKNPKDFRPRRPDGKGGYTWNLHGVERVLYRLPELLKADPSQTVFVVEGEKDVHSLVAMGRIATTNVNGAGKWRDEYAEDLRGRTVIVLPHNDKPGRDHAQKVAQSLSGKAASIKVVEIPGLPEKGDVSDFLARGGTMVQLDELVTRAPEWKVEPTPGPSPFEACDDPFRIARLFLEGYQHLDGCTMRFHRGELLRWESAWHPVPSEDVSAQLTSVAKAEYDRLNCVGNGKPLRVTRSVIGDGLQALKALTLLPEDRARAPCWIDGEGPFPAHELLPTRNALIHLPGFAAGRPGAIIPVTPRFFCSYALDYDFASDAPAPLEWFLFLNGLWPDDPESILTLQEWFGYCLTPDTRQQKILGLIGPKRAGKDTIARVLRALIGPVNVAGPTLSGLAGDFGLAPLIGKPLAIVSDARLSGRVDTAQILERLLTISGEGWLSVPRKHLSDWIGQLPTRFVLISNELPRFLDSSGAFASRLVILRLTQSFLGQEDQGLFDRIVQELPGILLWAIEGWKRLQERGRFRQPESAQELLEEMQDLTSPVGTFIRDRCRIAPELEVDTKSLYREWRSWCEDVGRKEPGDEQNFGRNLRAALPALKTRKTRRGEEQLRLYVGIETQRGF